MSNLWLPFCFFIYVTVTQNANAHPPCCHSECCCSTCPANSCSKNPGAIGVGIQCSCESTSTYVCTKSIGNQYQTSFAQLPGPGPLPPLGLPHYVSNNGLNLQSYPVVVRPNSYPGIGSGAYSVLGGSGFLKPCMCGSPNLQQNCLSNLPCSPQKVSILVANDENSSYWGRWHRHWYNWDFAFLETPQGLIIIAAVVILLILIFCLIGGFIVACIRGIGGSSSKKKDDVIVIEQQNPSYQRGSDFGKY